MRGHRLDYRLLLDAGRVPEVLGNNEGTVRGDEMNILTLAALMLAIVPLDVPIQSEVDAIEWNHFYDQDGRHVFDQVICWRFNRATCRHEVQAWWLVKDGSASGDMLRFDGSVMRRVTTGRFFESWTQYDRELFDRQQVPQENRRNLSPRMRDMRRVLEGR